MADGRASFIGTTLLPSSVASSMLLVCIVQLVPAGNKKILKRRTQNTGDNFGYYLLSCTTPGRSDDDIAEKFKEKGQKQEAIC